MQNIANSGVATLTPHLCREARTLLDLEPGEVAFIARIDPSKLQAFEAHQVDLPQPTLISLRRVFERVGAEFTPEEPQRGVRLRPSR